MVQFGRIDSEQFGLQEVLPPFDVPIHRTTEPARILEGKIEPDIPVYLVDNARYFDREGIYMYPDDADRFIFYCRATLEGLKLLLTASASRLSAHRICPFKWQTATSIWRLLGKTG